MSSNEPFASCPPVSRLRPRGHALAALLALAAACTPTDEPFELPPNDDPEATPEPVAAASSASPTGNTGGAPSVSQAGTEQPPVPGSEPAVIDGSTPPGALPSAPAAVDGSAPPGALPTSGGHAPPPPAASDASASGWQAAAPVALDAGVPDPGVLLPTGDAGVSLACAAEFATCVLFDVSGAGQCLDTYADCEPGFRGDAGADAGLNGECAVHFSACVLNDPLAFESCFPELIDCE